MCFSYLDFRYFTSIGSLIYIVATLTRTDGHISDPITRWSLVEAKIIKVITLKNVRDGCKELQVPSPDLAGFNILVLLNLVAESLHSLFCSFAKLLLCYVAEQLLALVVFHGVPIERMENSIL